MGKEAFTTSIDSDVKANFKTACDEININMNSILEAFMTQFAQNRFSIKISKEGMQFEIEDTEEK